MYIRPEQIAEQYEMEVKSISKGRDCFLCETDLGMRALKEYRGSVERAEFLAGMLDFLKEQNIVAEQIFYTKEGEIFARDEEEQNYLLLSVFRGAECDTKSREDMVYAVRLLAGLHNATEQYPDEVPEFVKMNPNALLLLYEKHNRELRQVRNYIRGRKQKNQYDKTLSGNNQPSAYNAVAEFHQSGEVGWNSAWSEHRTCARACQLAFERRLFSFL